MFDWRKEFKSRYSDVPNAIWLVVAYEKLLVPDALNHICVSDQAHKTSPVINLYKPYTNIPLHVAC